MCAEPRLLIHHHRPIRWFWRKKIMAVEARVRGQTFASACREDTIARRASVVVKVAQQRRASGCSGGEKNRNTAKMNNNFSLYSLRSRHHKKNK